MRLKVYIIVEKLNFQIIKKETRLPYPIYDMVDYSSS